MIPRSFTKSLQVGRHGLLLRVMYLCRLVQIWPAVHSVYAKLPPDNRKPLLRIAWDLIAYVRYIPNDPRLVFHPERIFDEYCKERIYLRNNRISEYILQCEWSYLYKWYLRLCPNLWDLLKSKKATAEYFASRGVRTPRQWGYLSKAGKTLAWRSMPDGRQETLKDVMAHELTLFFKPEGGLRGAGCFVLSLVGDDLCVNGEKSTEEQVADMVPENVELLGETFVAQHAALAALFPHSLNTLRLVTVSDGSGNVRCIRRFLRLGVGESKVDNWYAGGLVIGVDENGVLHGKGIYLDYTKPDEARHPDTGIEFEGYRLPMFEQAVAMVVEAHGHCTELPLVGWDVATTGQGPLLVEANALSGVVQGVTGGFRKLMNEELLPRVLEARSEYLQGGEPLDIAQL